MKKEDCSEISYWFENKNVLTVPCVHPPAVGEIIHIDTEMHEHWYDARWKDRKFFHKGVCSFFKVKSVKRFYRSIDIELDAKDLFPGETTSAGKIIFPSQIHIETFETQLEKLNEEEESAYLNS